MHSPTAAVPNTSFRSLVLPREHGSWTLALEPIALGPLVAPSPAGAFLALIAVAALFASAPVRIWRNTPYSGWRALWPLLLAGARRLTRRVERARKIAGT